MFLFTTGVVTRPAQVGATTKAKLPAVQRTDDVPAYPSVEQLKVQLSPLATPDEAQSLAYESFPEAQVVWDGVVLLGLA